MNTNASIPPDGCRYPGADKNATTCESMTTCLHTRMVSLAILVLLTASCTTTERRPAVRETMISWDQKTPAQILRQVMESREKIVSLTAAFSLQLDPPPQGRLSHMQGVLIYARKPDGVYVRIKVMGFLGRLIFDMVHRSDEILVYVPSRKTLYRGQTDIGDKGDAASALFKALLLDFGDVRVPPNAVLELDQDTVIVPLSKGKMIMKRDTGLLHEFHLGDEIVLYDEYQQESGLPPFPCRITVRQKDGMQFASCNLSQVRVNVVITDAFDLSVYQPKIIRDLGQLNMLETP